MRPGKIWIGGLPWMVDAEVADSDVPIESRTMRFLPTEKGAYLGAGPPTSICLHDKGAEGTAAQTYAHLRVKGLAVHASIEADGTFVQYADPAVTRTWHAGRANDWSVGIEITNAMFPDLRKRRSGEKWATFVRRLNPLGRPVVTRTYRGAKQDVLGHFPAQLETAAKVVAVLCEALGIPKRVPVDAKAAPWGGLLPKLRTSPTDRKKILGDIRAEAKSGVIGHYHVTNGHVDPASDVFDALLASGFEAWRLG